MVISTEPCTRPPYWYQCQQHLLFPALPVVGDFKAEYGFALEQQLISPRETERSAGSTNIDGNRRSSSFFTNLSIDPTSWVTATVGLRKTIKTAQQPGFRRQISNRA
jgi:hypothetical protein